jgi:membrane protein implicated in regulation of membrane protease activity
MNWQDFYLLAFLVGFLLSALAFLSGTVHIPHVHLPGHGHVGKIGAKIGGRSGLSPFNFGTFAAFLAWFGGTGYLLERYSNVWVYLGLLVSIASGLGGASLVFWLLFKLMEKDQPLDPADFEMTGVLGRMASPIRSGGTGELIYSCDGTRRAAPARSDEGIEIPRNTEVVVTRFEKGIAYVRRWEEMSGADS